MKGAKTPEIRSEIQKEYPDHPLLLDDVREVEVAFKKKEHAKKTPQDELIQFFIDKKYEASMESDESNNLSALFFANPRSIKTAQRYNRVFLLDYSQTIRRYHKPLLRIVGYTPHGTFYVAFCIIPDLNSSSCEWALSKFRSIFDSWDESSVLFSDRGMKEKGL